MDQVTYYLFKNIKANYPLTEDDRRNIEDAKKRDAQLNDAEKNLGFDHYVNNLQEE